MSRHMANVIEDSIEGKKRKTKVVAITSGKGGVGKTNFTVNYALTLIDYGYKVIVLDADLGMANIDLVLGVTPKANLFHVLSGQTMLKDIIIDGPKGLKVIPGGSGIPELADLQSEQVWHFIYQLEELEVDTDLLLIDTGAGISKNVLSFLLAADEVILITTPEPTAIADAYGMIKTLLKQQWNKDKQIKLLINRVENHLEGENAAAKIEAAVDKFLKYKITTLGFVPKDDFVSRAVKIQTPFTIEFPRCKAAIELNKIVANQYNKPVKDTGTTGIVSFMRNLLKI